MQHAQLIQQLRTLRVPGMVEALEQQLEQPATHSDLCFDVRRQLPCPVWRQLPWPVERIVSTFSSSVLFSCNFQHRFL